MSKPVNIYNFQKTVAITDLCGRGEKIVIFLIPRGGRNANSINFSTY